MSDLMRLGERLDELDGEEDSDANGVYTFHGWIDACAPTDPINGIEIEEYPSKPDP